MRTPSAPPLARPGVLLLVHNLEIGGAQRVVLTLSRELTRLGWRPVVCAWRRGGLLEAPLREAGIHVEVADRERGGWRRLGVPRELRQVIERTRIDMIHAHMSDAAVWAVLMRRLAGVPCVISHHSPDLSDLGGGRGPVHRAARLRLLASAARRADHNIAVSEAVRDQLMTLTRIAPDRVSVIPNGVRAPSPAAVEAAAHARQARAESGYRLANQPRLAYAGRLGREKDLDVLIAALPLIAEAFPGAALDLIGGGPDEDRLRRAAAASGTEPRVRFTGFVLDVGPRLAAADLYVSPSRIEGTPLAVIEAMAWGLPIVVSRVPGHEALCEPGPGGALFEPGNPRALAKAAIETLRRGHDRSRALARAASASRKFDAVKAAVAHARIYDAVLARHGWRQPV